MKQKLLFIPFFVMLCFSQVLAQNYLIDTTFNVPNVDTINTYSINYKTDPGILQLMTGENENLAKGHFAYVVYTGKAPTDTSRSNGRRLVDGLYTSPSFVEIPSLNSGGLAGSYFIIDLEAVRKVKKVMMYTLGNSPNTRPRAYTIYTGMDTNSINMDKVFQDNDNQTPTVSAVFSSTNCRYIKIVFDVLAQNNSCVISEVEVYGEGYLPQGEYYSSVRKLAKKVNFGEVEFIGTRPTGTNIYLSFRTGANPTIDSTWSKWSDSVDVTKSLFEVFEPRQYIQYKVRLVTKVLETPTVDEIKIFYDTLNIASSTNAFITPQYAQILKEQTFTLSIDTKFATGDYGIDTIYVLTPSPVKLKGVNVNGVSASVVNKVTANDIWIIFNSTVKSDSKIDIQFVTTPFLGVSPYKVFISSKLQPRNPQRVDTKVTDRVEAWSIVTMGVPDKLIIMGNAVPNPFTPNGDGKNDVTHFEFYLGNLAQPTELIGKQSRKLTLKIFDLNGRVIRNLVDQPTRAYAYVSDNAIVWDGKDDNGKIVRPGVYIYQIFIDSDNGGEYLTKTVVVSY